MQKNKNSKTKQLDNSSARLRSIKIIAVTIVLILMGVAGLFYGSVVFHYYKQTADLTHAIQMRDLILESIPGEAAPVDFKTGDIYFSEARLYLPKTTELQSRSLTYYYSSESYNGSGPELTVSSRQAISQATQVMNNADSVEKVFEAVPKLQACSRGVKLLYTKPNPAIPEDDFKQTVQLNNGKQLHIYIEKACPELNSMAKALAGIKAY